MGKKILIVDDEYEVTEIVKKMLQSEGYTTFVALSGKECLQVLKQEKIDLIFLDILMPGMDGWETLKKIKSNKKWRDVPVSMLTALPLTPSDTKDKPINLFENYLVKPFTKKVIVQKIEDILNRHTEINKMFVKIKKEIGEEYADEYKKLSLAVNRHRRIIAAIVDSAVDELKEPIRNVILSQKRMIEIMNKRIKEIEKMTEETLKKK
jgi:CheY-like chemotaxis protein